MVNTNTRATRFVVLLGTTLLLSLSTSPKANEAPRATVKLPFPPGATYRVHQGNHGQFSHNVPSREYAWDFGLPDGSLVTAAAAGRVVEVVQRYHMGGNEKRFLNHANYILLDHGGGVFTEYRHLQHNSAHVQVGETVAKGQTIARSGRTGYTSGPHLHFQVSDFRGQSIPARFEDVPIKDGVPQEDDVVTSGPLKDNGVDVRWTKTADQAHKAK